MNPNLPRSSSKDLSRRDFLRAGSLAMVGFAMPSPPDHGQGAHATMRRPHLGRASSRSCILLLLTGGPSHIDTFDPKPNAPAEIRGPFRAIRTNVPGIQISELLPRTARQADKFALIRSMHHTAAGVHETGLQLLQTGRLTAEGLEYPHAGSVCSYFGPRSEIPAHVLMPDRMGSIGGGLSHGQTAGFLDRRHDPVVCHCCASSAPTGPLLTERWHTAADLSSEPEPLRAAYGESEFGQCCLAARRLVERGTRFVTVNMFRTLHRRPTWDAHGSVPFGNLADYARTVAPSFDAAYSTLLADLSARGLLEQTLVVAAGEFGRTPRINPAGGRDHWTGCWSILLAGGGVKGGRVIGASDRIGACPADRPTTLQEVQATIYHCMGVPAGQTLPGPDGRAIPLLESGAGPITELF